MPDTSPVPGEAAAPDQLIAGLRAANARLRELLAERDEQIAKLLVRVEQISQLEAVVAELQAKVADLAARSAKNSKNSSKPPSSDGLARPGPKSLRGKSGRKPGRPQGQPGVTMRLTDYPDMVIRYEPASCRGCGTGLEGAAETGAERRQVTEIPPVRGRIYRHRLVSPLQRRGLVTVRVLTRRPPSSCRSRLRAEYLNGNHQAFALTT